MRIRTMIVAAFVCLGAAEASAQTCLGLPSFSEGPYQASAGVSFGDGAQGFGGGMSLGSDEIFGGATLGFTNMEEDASATSFAANIGATFVLNERERIEACPVAAVIVTSGPDVGDVDVSIVGLRAGGRLGLVALESGNMQIVPTFGLDIAYDRATADFGGTDVTARETYAIARVGAGFILNRRIGLVPMLGIPLGLDGSDPEFSFTVALNFGDR